MIFSWDGPSGHCLSHGCHWFVIWVANAARWNDEGRELISVPILLLPNSQLLLVSSLPQLLDFKLYISLLPQLCGRRSQYHGGIVLDKGLLQATLPNWLWPLAMRMHDETKIFGDTPPNHVLINSYMPGQGIMVSTHLFYICHLSLLLCSHRYWHRMFCFSHMRMGPSITLVSAFCH